MRTNVSPIVTSRVGITVVAVVIAPLLRRMPQSGRTLRLHPPESSARPRKVGSMTEMLYATGLPMEAQLCIQGCLHDHHHQPHRHSKRTDLILLALSRRCRQLPIFL